MKSKGKKTDLKEFREKELSDEQIRANIADSTKKKILMYYTPLAITAVLAIVYFLTMKWFWLVLVAVTFFMSLFGIEGNSNTCPECHKWGKVIWYEKGEKKIRTTKHTIKNSDGTEFTKEEKEEVDRRKGKCYFCGKEVQKEKVKRYNK